MITIDTNPEHGLALVCNDPDAESAQTRYVPLADAPALTDSEEPTYRRQVYLHQLHYVASHVIVGLQVHDRIAVDGSKPPRAGWARWKPL